MLYFKAQWVFHRQEKLPVAAKNKRWERWKSSWCPSVLCFVKALWYKKMWGGLLTNILKWNFGLSVVSEIDLKFRFAWSTHFSNCRILLHGGNIMTKTNSKLPPTSKAWQFVIVFQLPTTINNPLAFHCDQGNIFHPPTTPKVWPSARTFGIGNLHFQTPHSLINQSMKVHSECKLDYHYVLSALCLVLLIPPCLLCMT